jgi:hypothetical protein
LDEYGLAVLGAWLTTINPAEAIARRGAAVALTRAEDDEDTRRELQGNLAWLDGILAFARGNHQELLAARRRGLQSGHRYAGMIDRSLAAFGHALAGNRVVAGRGLAALESGWLRSDFGDFVTPNIAIDRIAAATWLLEAGDTAQAARLLFWHQSTAISGWEASFSYAVTPLAYLMLARIEHAQGRNGDAIGHYRQFLRRYDSPMANQRHLVDEARTALTGLAGADPAERRRIHGHDPGS